MIHKIKYVRTFVQIKNLKIIDMRAEVIIKEEVLKNRTKMIIKMNFIYNFHKVLLKMVKQEFNRDFHKQ